MCRVDDSASLLEVEESHCCRQWNGRSRGFIYKLGLLLEHGILKVKTWISDNTEEACN